MSFPNIFLNCFLFSVISSSCRFVYLQAASVLGFFPTHSLIRWNHPQISDQSTEMGFQQKYQEKVSASCQLETRTEGLQTSAKENSFTSTCEQLYH